MKIGETKRRSNISKFLKWDGREGTLSYYDKDGGQTKIYNLEKFIVLKIGYAVKGWCDKNQSGIYSNEIEKFSEEFVVKTFNGGVIASGNWKDIKEQVKDKGGSLNIAITCYANDEIIEMFFKGKSFFTLSETFKAFGLNKEYKFGGAIEEKKGAIKYMIPKIIPGENIEDIQKYIDMANKLDIDIDVNLEAEEEQDDDLPF